MTTIPERQQAILLFAREFFFWENREKIGKHLKGLGTTELVISAEPTTMTLTMLPDGRVTLEPADWHNLSTEVIFALTNNLRAELGLNPLDPTLDVISFLR